MDPIYVDADQVNVQGACWRCCGRSNSACTPNSIAPESPGGLLLARSEPAALMILGDRRAPAPIALDCAKLISATSS